MQTRNVDIKSVQGANVKITEYAASKLCDHDWKSLTFSTTKAFFSMDFMHTIMVKIMVKLICFCFSRRLLPDTVKFSVVKCWFQRWLKGLKKYSMLGSQNEAVNECPEMVHLLAEKEKNKTKIALHEKMLVKATELCMNGIGSARQRRSLDMVL